MMMGGKKKGGGKAKARTYKFYASGYNLPARALLHGALKLNGLNSTMYDQNDLAKTYDPAWANADGLIVAVDASDNKLVAAWAAAAGNNPNFTSAQVAGTMATPMTLEQLGTQGVDEAVALVKASAAA